MAARFLRHLPPGAVRETEHLLVETSRGEWHLLSSLWNRNDTMLITIRPQNGDLCYYPQRGLQLFATEKDALDRLTKDGVSIKRQQRARAILGYIAIGDMAAMLIATRVKCEMMLAGIHPVHSIVEAEWVHIPLTAGQHDKRERKNFETLEAFPLAEYHYYCESYDLTHAFPSNKNVSSDYDPDFCWNHYLTEKFSRLGLRSVCPVLLQGMANCTKVHFRGKELFVSLILKKSTLNPGTRYVARGLDEHGAPGNEYECEQVLWVKCKQTPGEEGPPPPIEWSSYLWRRGTVPVRWRTDVKNAIAEPELIVDAEPYRGCTEYYRRIIERHGRIPVTIVNLLRCELGHHETILSDVYQESIKMVTTETQLPIKIINFDWHRNLKKLSVPKAIEGLWTQVQLSVMENGLSTGRVNLKADPLQPSPQPETAHEQPRLDTSFTADDDSDDGGDRNAPEIVTDARQRGFLRVNCADSLDRTNACLFFVCFQVLAEQCRHLGIGILEPKRVPAGISQPWPYFSRSFDQIKVLFDMGLLSVIAEQFVRAGDVASFLYTNTPAMHTGVIREFAPNLKSAPNNTRIVVQRRIHNVTDDKVRQAQYEMFVGEHIASYFPSTQEPRPYLVSAGTNSCVVKAVPSIAVSQHPDALIKRIGHSANASSSSSSSSRRYQWMCPRDHDFTEVTIFLEQACRVTHLVLSLPRCGQVVTSPRYVDVSVGEHMDNARMAFQRLELPQCRDATDLVYRFPSFVSGLKASSPLYDFEGDDDHSSQFVRVLSLTFYGIAPGAFMGMGGVGVYGYLPQHGSTAGGQSPEDIALEVKKVLFAELCGDIRGGIAGMIVDDDSSEGSAPDATPAEKPSTPESEPPRPPSPPAVSDDGNDDDDASDSDSGDEDGPAEAEAEAEAEGETAPAADDDDDDGVPGAAEVAQWTASERAAKYREQVEAEWQLKKHQGTFSYTDALRLEAFRVALGMDADARDRVLLELKMRLLDFDPNKFLRHRDEKGEKRLRKSSMFAASHCYVCGQTGLGFSTRNTCHYCRHTICKQCVAKKKRFIPEYGWTRKPHKVCKECDAKLNRQSRLVDRITGGLLQLRQNQWTGVDRSRRLRQAICVSAYGRPAFDLERAYYAPQTSTPPTANAELCVSEFPMCGFLSSVPVGDDGVPAEALLYPAGLLPDEVAWSAPPAMAEVSMVVVLSTLCKLKTVALLVPCDGYTSPDAAPIVHLGGGTLLSSMHAFGEWDLWDERTKLAAHDVEDPADLADEIPGYTTLTITMPDDNAAALPCRFLSIRLCRRAVAEGGGGESGGAAIRVARIRAIGEPVSSSLQPLTLTEQREMAKITNANAAAQYTTLKTTRSRFEQDTNTMEIAVERGPARGFVLLLPNATAAGSDAPSVGDNPIDQFFNYVDCLRVSMLRLDADGAAVLPQQLGEYVIPRVARGAGPYIWYLFDEPQTESTVFQFEFVSVHRLDQRSLPRLFLFA